MDPAGHASPGYAEWEAAEARRLDRLDRIGTQPEQQAGQQEDALDSPPRAHGYDQTSTGSEPSSGSEGTSPVRSSYGRYLQARSASPCRPLRVPFSASSAAAPPPARCRTSELSQTRTAT